MKIWINKVIVLCFLSLTILGCEKDEDRLVLKMGQAPALTASSSNLILTEENAANEAVTFTWNRADFGFDAAVSYALQIDTAGDGFKKPYSVSLGNNMEKSYTVEELNNLMTKLKYTVEEAHDVPVRIKATVSDLVDPVYSNVTTLSVTPYSTYVEPGYIYVPGGYQGWNPGTAPSMISVENNGVYQGPISFVGADNLEFKFTANKNWDLNYGAGATAGSLSENGGNLTVPSADTYMITVDLNKMTWSSAKHSWGIIGSATAGGWDTDTNLKFVHDEGVWKLTTALSAGELKFRFNDDWALNYGDDDASNNLLNANGANIAIAAEGTYDIILDVDNEDGTATYSIVKK